MNWSLSFSPSLSIYLYTPVYVNVCISIYIYIYGGFVCFENNLQIWLCSICGWAKNLKSRHGNITEPIDVFNMFPTPISQDRYCFCNWAVWTSTCKNSVNNCVYVYVYVYIYRKRKRERERERFTRIYQVVMWIFIKRERDKAKERERKRERARDRQHCESYLARQTTQMLCIFTWRGLATCSDPVHFYLVRLRLNAPGRQAESAQGLLPRPRRGGEAVCIRTLTPLWILVGNC